ncbi:hypothetical protein Tco_0481196 [Tanacetum coccineum]
MDDGVVNWGEHTEEEVETNHALMAISSNNKCEQEVKILAYDQAVKKLEAQVVTFQKQQLSLNEQLTFQANELYEKDEKLKKYRRIGMKAVKEKEQLQKIVDSWKDSSKNLWKLVDSGMSSTSKVGLGYEIKSNDEVLSYEEEMNRTVFNCTKEDFIDKPLYSRFSKTDSFKGVPHPLTRDYTPKPQQEIDESLYVYGKKGPQKPEISVSDDTFSENSVTTNEKVVSEPKPTEVEPSCVTHVKTPRQPMKNQGTPKVNGKNWNEMMERELGEVWNNANRVNHANHFVPRPVQLIVVRQNVNSVRPNVNTGRANVNSVRQNVNSVRSNVNTGSFNINTVKAKQPINTSNSNSFSPVRPQVNKFNQRSNFSKSHSPVRRPIVRNTAKMSYTHAVKGNWGTAVKTSAGYNWRKTRPNSNCNSGSNFIRTDHPLKNMKDKSEVFKTPTQSKTSGEEDISPTTLEAAKTLSKVASQRSKSVDKGKRYKRRKESKGKDIDTGFEDISTGFEDISTGFEEVNTGGLGVSTGSGPVSSARGQREGKAPMIVEETQAPKRTKEQIQQEEASLAEAIRLQTLEEEETAKQVHLDALLAKRLAEEEEAKLEANAELTKDVLGKDLSEQDFAKRMNQGTWKLSQLKKLKFEEIKEEFEKLVKQVDTFVPINIEATKAQLKKYGEELQTEISKKQRIDDKDVLDTEEKVGKVKEEEPVKRVGKRKKQKARKGISIDKSPQGDLETDKEESVEAMNPTPLDTKSNIVANWKIFQQGERSIYQIIRANGADTVYMSFGAMLKDFTREDLIELYRLVMHKYGTNRPEDAYDRVLWSDLRTMFDPPLNEDAI